MFRNYHRHITVEMFDDESRFRRVFPNFLFLSGILIQFFCGTRFDEIFSRVQTLCNDVKYCIRNSVYSHKTLGLMNRVLFSSGNDDDVIFCFVFFFFNITF